MIIDCISDLHGHFPKLEGGDLLIIAGDLTGNSYLYEIDRFHDWALTQDYKKVIVIPGNHDTFLMANPFFFPDTDDGFHYLCDSGAEFEGLKIWGSPWTKRFPGMNPQAMAFTVETEEELAKKWELIPNDVDILITHCPLFTCLDSYYNAKDRRFHNAGSPSLNKVLDRIKPRLHVFGHIHESGGREDVYLPKTIIVNASHVNEHYEPVNKPIRIEL